MIFSNRISYGVALSSGTVAGAKNWSYSAAIIKITETIGLRRRKCLVVFLR